MLNTERLKKVYGQLEELGVRQMLVSDPVAIFYLTGKWLHPGERFLGLYLNADTQPHLFLNDLFRFDEEIGAVKVPITDTTDLITLLKTYVDHSAPLGVDKELAAKFLIPMYDAQIASGIRNTSLAIDNARALKDAQEIEWMRESSRINDRAMEQFRACIREGVTEKEAASQFLSIYQSLGASGYSFHPIVAFGANSADPHHGPDDTVLKEGDTVLIDVGCKYHDYCSDMTRTFFYKTVPSEEARRVYELVRNANQSAEDMCRPGITLASIDKTARDIIEEGGYGPDFTHRLGHFIGIQDHDFGDVSQANMNLTQVGNTFSIEPGIYNAKAAGVRIEDLVLITEDGHEVLNKYPKDLQIIE
ncbi:MAG: Xaa-Pro peptidase family protein [Erysipelotrichaceae bacterium]|nr:Xaa-Pro peptidase family protein [Erysipelotrichaceae bacterium]